VKMLPAGARPYYDNVRTAAGRDGEGSQTGSFKEMLLELKPEERLAAATQLLAEEVARILRMPVSKFDVDRSLDETGFDSLMGLELQLSIESRFGVTLPSTEFAAGLSTIQIAARILGLATTDEDTELFEESAAEKASTALVSL
jgi:phthiocerol/phenolphthiocerol synthesis type-I polyketide synthase C